MVVLFLVGLLLFITDILNSSKFPVILLYPESVNIRFLSAFPLGFFLSKVIMQISGNWISFGNQYLVKSTAIKLLSFVLFISLSYFLIFSHIHLLSGISEILLGSGCVVFLTLLYMILCICIVLLCNKQVNNGSALITGLSLALFHIICIGGIHIRFLHFEQLFS